MRLSRVASVFLKRRIRPRYIRIEVNAKFPGAVCVAPVPLPVAYSNHRRPVETMREGGWGRGRKWELRGTKEERSWKWVNGGEYFFWRQVQRRGKNGRRWLWNLHQSGDGKNRGVWKKRRCERMMRKGDEWVNEAEEKLIGKWERNCSNKILIFCVRL